MYATAFGIADKVIKALKVKYPEFVNQQEMINSGYTYLYMMNRMNFDRAVTSCLQRAYSSSLAERAARNAASNMGSWSSGGGRRTADFLAVEAGGRWPVGGRSVEADKTLLPKQKKGDKVWKKEI